MTASKIDDHAQRARDRLPSQHADDPNMQVLLDAFSIGVQDLEDALHSLLTERAIDTAVGEQLDVIGRLVLETRRTDVDEAYRVRLRARIATNKSKGTIEQIINVVRLALRPGDPTIAATQHYPAAVQVDVTDLAVSIPLASVVAGFLRDATAAGVLAHFVSSAADDDDTLYTSLSAYLSGFTGSGAGSLTVDDASKFPPTGQITLDTGLVSEETVTYTSRTDTVFTLSGTTANNHDANTDCQFVGSIGLGLGNTDDPDDGGFIASVFTDFVPVIPVASAVTDVAVVEGSIVNCDGSGSTDATTFAWTADHPDVVFADSSAETTTFVAPQVDGFDTVVVTLTVGNETGATDEDTSNVVVVDS